VQAKICRILKMKHSRSNLLPNGEQQKRSAGERKHGGGPKSKSDNDRRKPHSRRGAREVVEVAAEPQREAVYPERQQTAAPPAWTDPVEVVAPAEGVATHVEEEERQDKKTNDMMHVLRLWKLLVEFDVPNPERYAKLLQT
jgi:hypothetical protein